MIDEKVNWKYHISFIHRMSMNTGIFYKLTHYLTPMQQRQIYILYFSLSLYNMCHYIVAWGCTYKSYIDQLQTVLNNIVRIFIFLEPCLGKTHQVHRHC